ncbi:hypothetical protein H6G89_27545 [Oscillatoria sp. FACHB-1407]|uniref:hypothetical protein n=1 Tax=Oscillatoria sp. FACHB-1407 TaxID=2692847 RepID=UPI00168745C7|nr:hypothetical protein [Oscillatoria sp. FACHB-1407]MBD2464761.1 hypothetical protein [Oscillatoria sp. FACHB-1407]
MVESALGQSLYPLLLSQWAIALIIACVTASFVKMKTAYEFLKLSQTTYYEQ